MAPYNRDIQPCNIIVSGTSIEDILWWNDELDTDGKVLGYVKRCKITLIDFGFARALAPDDLSVDVGLEKAAKESEVNGPSRVRMYQSNNKENKLCVNGMLQDSSIDNVTKPRGRTPTRVNFGMDYSQSCVRIRDLSALGTRNYAAPEIMSGLRRATSALSLSVSSHMKNKDSRDKSKTKKALAECVSSYGMVADAFSGKSTC